MTALSIPRVPSAETVGRHRRLARIADRAGLIRTIAIDHPDNYLLLFDDDISKVSFEEVVDSELEMIEKLSQHATSVLADPVYSFGQSIVTGALPGGVGLITGIEDLYYTPSTSTVGFDTELRRREGWQPAKLATLGADAAKLVVSHREDGDAEEITAQHDVVARAARDCHALGLPLVLEPLWYPTAEEDLSDSEVRERRRRSVVSSARSYHADGATIMKVEFPLLDLDDLDACHQGCADLDDAIDGPWVLLSAGVTFEGFRTGAVRGPGPRCRCRRPPPSSIATGTARTARPRAELGERPGILVRIGGAPRDVAARGGRGTGPGRGAVVGHAIPGSCRQRHDGVMSDDAAGRAQRALEEGISTDFSTAMSYGAYLHLDTLLSAQHPRSEPPQHDEVLFIIQHQVAELWLKLLLHELHSARALIAADQLAAGLKRLARVKHIQKQLVEQWDVLATLTPSEYALIRPFLATSSGFQSHQYRSVEFLLGNKNADMVRVFEHDPPQRDALEALLREPTVYDEFLRFLARKGYAVPASVLERDVTLPYRLDEGLVDVFAGVYGAPSEHWGVYETCEELVDIEDLFQQWRFRHLQVVTRTIGHKLGTGGSSGVDFLHRALDLTFFPELYAVRTRVG